MPGRRQQKSVIEQERPKGKPRLCLDVATMPKKSKKSKSKRQTLKQKYKVIKKVKEHHKKKAKELRKQVKAGRKPKAPKDPGIPSQWPFKQELVKELEWEKQRILATEKQKKAERRAARVRTAVILPVL